MADLEYRFPMPGAVEGSDWLLRYDGRVLEVFNLYSGGSTRLPIPETRFERGEPDRKDRVTYKLRSSTDNVVMEIESGPEHVAGLDDFVATLEQGKG